jgi:hypothetical protein
MNALFDIIITVGMLGFLVAVVALTTRASGYATSVLSWFRDQIRKEPKNVRREAKSGELVRHSIPR